MARRGVFGRLPSAAPDLTNTIVSLIREAMAQEDSNIVNAWKSGGKVQGKGVDDERLLAHMKARRDNLDPSDPSYDEWNNNYIQYDFAIHESKMALANDEGKVSDKEMANFYRKWAGRTDVQKDSEFYRSLLSRAAKWNEAAKARSAGNGARAAAEAHQNWANNFYKREVQGAETANGYLLVIAQTYGAAPPNADSLDDIDPNSVAYGKFMDVIEDGKADDPNVQGLINEMNKAIKDSNPNWVYSQSNLTELLSKGDQGLKRLVSQSTSDSERKEWSSRRTTLRYEQSRVKQTQANERIQIASDTYATDLDHCNGDPYCARNATTRFRDTLQKEAGNVIAGAGGARGLNAMTQDVRTSSALVNTIEQLNSALDGKDVVPPAAKVGQSPDANAEGYTTFDAAGGRDSPTGWLANTLNGINGDSKKLDAGGWIMTQPVEQNGAPVLDGNGQPVYQYTIYDASVPRPAGAIAVPGVSMMTDQSRAATGPQGPTPVTATPVQYVMPSSASIVYTMGGQTVDPQTAADVKLFNGQQGNAAPPWVELRGVKGPDGTVRTLYRTGNGVDVPFLFHEQAPVPVDAPKPVNGQYVVPVTVGADEKGAQYLKADLSSYYGGVTMAREKTKSGAYVQGTFATSGAASTAKAIGDLFNSPVPGASVKADQYLRQFQQGINALPASDPNKIAGMQDFAQLSTTVNLYKQGKVGKALGDAYDEANARTPQAQGYANQLNKAGITVQSVGEAEFSRRMSLLTGIEDADERISARRASLLPGVTGDDPMSKLRLKGGLWSSLIEDESQVRGARNAVLDPTISVSNIRVPGMPQMMQPGQAPTLNNQPGGYGGFGPMVFGANGPKPFPAPATAMVAPPTTKPPASPSNLPQNAPPPTTPPPVPYTPPPMPTQQSNPGYYASEKGYAPPKPKVPTATPSNPYMRPS